MRAGTVELDDLIFRRTSFPPDELSAGRNGDYIWRDLWTGLSVCNRSVTGSLAFGSSHGLGRCCLWLAALPFRWIGSAEVPLYHHLLPAVSRSASHEVEAPFLSPLCRHPVWPDGGSVFAELSMYELDMSLYAPLCHLLSFGPAVHRTASREGEMFSLPPCFRLILTFCYCFYDFLRELDLGSGRSPDRDEADPFHGQTRWAKLNYFAPDIPDAMDLWALGPHAILVKVISVCRLHVFFHQYVADLRERKSENVLRTVSASPLILDMTVSGTSGVIATPPEVPARKVLPLATGVNILHAVSSGTPFVVPPAPGIERPVMQAHEFLTCRPLKSRQSLPLLSLSVSSSALMLPRYSAKYSSSSFSLDHCQPLRGNTSPPVGEALLPPPADDCVVSGLDDPNTAVRRELFPGSESPCSLPAYATVRAVLLVGPFGAFDWVGFQDLYDTARGIIDLCNARDPGSRALRRGHQSGN